jgi:Kelch motif protein
VPSPQPLLTQHRLQLAVPVTIVLLSVFACDSNTTTPTVRTVSLTMVAGDTQRAAIDGPVAIAPAVRVLDDAGTPVAGHRVQFVVVLGGGQLSASADSSDAQGIATIGWTLGAAPGPNALVATAQGPGADASAVLFRATAYTPNAWSTVSAMPTARWSVGVGVVNDVLYAIGGSRYGACGFPDPPDCEIEVLGTVEAYDPVRNQWSTKAAMPTPREDFGLAVANGRIYVIGGHITSVAPLQTVEEYDPSTNTWATRAPMPTARFMLGAATTQGIIYAVGGATPSVVATVEAYDPVSNTWTTRAPLPTPRFAIALVSGGQGLYAVSGGSSTGSVVRAVEVYDPVSNTWAAKDSLAIGRQYSSASVVNGVLYVMGGANAFIRPEVEAYDPASNTWSLKAPMPQPRVVLATGVIGGIVYAVGGGTASAIVATTEAYQP